MRHLLVLLALLLAALTALPSCQSPAYDVRYPSVAAEATAVRQIILDYDLDGEMDSACTAWHLEGDTWVTAKHCTEDGPSIRFADGLKEALVIDRCHATADVCLVYTWTNSGGTLPLGTAPAFGTPVHVIGFPYFGEFHHVVLDGRWNGDPDNDGEYEITLFGDGGASGAPVIDADGFVVGVLVSSFRGRPYSYAVPVSAIRDIL